MHEKKILLGVTSGIAAYKSCSLLRSLQKLGAEVRVIVTPDSLEFVALGTWQALSKGPVAVKVFNNESPFEHIDIARWADVFLIAPTTANTIGHLANGTTPNLLCLTYLATNAQKIIVPAMNTVMWQAPAVQRNLKQLKDDGVRIVAPESGLMACGEIGEGRYPEESKIIGELEDILYPSSSKTVLISAGRTEEAIDPVRYISNRSSGKTALAIAKSFKKKGFKVLIVSGPVSVEWPSWCHVKSIRSALDMQKALELQFDKTDVFVSCAAVADFRPSEVATQKIKGSKSLDSIPLEKNPDILHQLAHTKTTKQIVVGFALETHSEEKFALDKLKSKGCDLLVFNTPVRSDSGFGKDSVEVGILDHSGTLLPLALRSKEELSDTLVTLVEEKLA